MTAANLLGPHQLFLGAENLVLDPVRTVVVNRVDLALEIHEREALALDLHTDRAVFGNLRLLGDFDELGACARPLREWYAYTTAALGRGSDGKV